MIYGTGVDITEIGRVKTLLDRQLRFCEKVLTAKERAVFDSLGPRRQAEFAAGRFSAKESYSKAYGTGIGSAVGFQDIEILDNELGKPEITKQPFSGSAWVSISHTEKLVMTQVILERGID